MPRREWRAENQTGCRAILRGPPQDFLTRFSDSARDSMRRHRGCSGEKPPQ
jgi:hypothetical protein